jgi:hypothetical protein
MLIDRAKHAPKKASDITVNVILTGSFDKMIAQCLVKNTWKWYSKKPTFSLLSLSSLLLSASLRSARW